MKKFIFAICTVFLVTTAFGSPPGNVKEKIKTECTFSKEVKSVDVSNVDTAGEFITDSNVAFSPFLPQKANAVKSFTFNSDLFKDEISPTKSRVAFTKTFKQKSSIQYIIGPGISWRDKLEHRSIPNLRNSC